MERLLFVDDDIEILSLNRSYFTEHGYDVDTGFQRGRSDGTVKRQVL